LSRLPDADAVLATAREIVSAPTAPYHEARALAAIAREIEKDGLEVRLDEYGQLHARLRRGSARPVVILAHTDHPAFEVVTAHGREGSARVLGGFRGGVLDVPAAVQVYDDHGGGPFPATIDRFVPDADLVHNSAGRVRIRSAAALAPGQWAVLDLPGLEVHGDELRMRAADDLAGCALIVLALREAARASFAVDVTGLFTRAEETGLYGARLVAEDGAIPRDAVVISVEASRALPHVPSGRGIVLRVGDLHNTFTNDAERFLRAGGERLVRDGIAVQRALLDGGTCESSTFVVNGWSTTAIALPNVNYHNRGPDDRFAPEIVRLGDIQSGVALLVEGLRAVAEDLRETWWASAGPVPGVVKAILRGERRSPGT
jgi:putative aminopeptidase FrvX